MLVTNAIRNSASTGPSGMSIQDNQYKNVKYVIQIFNDN